MVEVRAPFHSSKDRIDTFVISKANWIQQRLAAQQEAKENQIVFANALNYGSQVYVRNKLYTLAPIYEIEGERHLYSPHNPSEGYLYLPPNLSQEQIKPACIKVYRNIAGRHITERVIEFAARMNVDPLSIRITSAKKRWGSCSLGKGINFSWRLIMGSDEVIDYVVVHELSHILQMNHSPAFWRIVAIVLPDYKERRAELYELQKRIVAEDWG